MHIRKLKLNKRSYDIIVGSDLFIRLSRYIKSLKIGDSAYIITNSFLKAKYGPTLTRAFKNAGFSIRIRTVADSETSKSIHCASKIINDLALFDKKRRIFIVAFGGGVVGDLSGFVASIYKRGVPYFQIPTTLLAQVDSSIGGKTGVDLTRGKNLVGTFYQPRAVFCDIALLKSLGIRQMKSGLAEVIKYGIIRDPKLFRYLEKNYKKIIAFDNRALEFIVERSSSIKAQVVQKDEREEKGIRTVLNFGHTFAHAIECAGNFKAYNHGEAVAIGMVAAADMSVALGLTKEDNLNRISSLIEAVGLSAKVKGLSIKKIIDAHYHDKKFIGAKNKFVLIRGIGKTVLRTNVPLALIRSVISRRM
jgi:3-dehydroquinate synthase